MRLQGYPPVLWISVWVKILLQMTVLFCTDWILYDVFCFFATPLVISCLQRLQPALGKKNKFKLLSLFGALLGVHNEFVIYTYV